MDKMRILLKSNLSFTDFIDQIISKRKGLFKGVVSLLDVVENDARYV